MELWTLCLCLSPFDEWWMSPLASLPLKGLNNDPLVLFHYCRRVHVTEGKCHISRDAWIFQFSEVDVVQVHVLHTQIQWSTDRQFFQKFLCSICLSYVFNVLKEIIFTCICCPFFVCFHSQWTWQLLILARPSFYCWSWLDDLFYDWKVNIFTLL